MNAATKLDVGKARVDLIPADALLGAGAGFAYGERKYSARNWEKGMAWGRLVGSLLRHLFAWMAGEDVDPESGLHHLDHMTCCALMLSASVKRGIGVDDRKAAP